MAELDRYRILVIDDESSIRESLTEYFLDYNIKTHAVSSAEEALELLQHEPFDLVVVDVRLPGLNGDLFVPAAHKLQNRLKFIIHTGSVHFKISPELAALGLTESEVFLKPVFDLEQLLERVRALLPEEDP